MLSDQIDSSYVSIQSVKNIGLPGERTNHSGSDSKLSAKAVLIFANLSLTLSELKMKRLNPNSIVYRDPYRRLLKVT